MISFKFTVVLSRIGLFPTLISKIKWLLDVLVTDIFYLLTLASDNNIQKMSPIWKFIVTKINSPASTCHQHLYSPIILKKLKIFIATLLRDSQTRTVGLRQSRFGAFWTDRGSLFLVKKFWISFLRLTSSTSPYQFHKFLRRVLWQFVRA